MPGAKRFLGLKFRRQHVIRGYVVDFYCPDLKLAIEIDGSIHQHIAFFDRLGRSLKNLIELMNRLEERGIGR